MHRRDPKKHKGCDLGSRRCSCPLCVNAYGTHPQKYRADLDFSEQVADPHFDHVDPLLLEEEAHPGFREAWAWPYGKPE